MAAARLYLYQHPASAVASAWIEKQLRMIVAPQIEYPVAGNGWDEKTRDTRAIVFVPVIGINRAGVEGRHVKMFSGWTRWIDPCAKRGNRARRFAPGFK